LVLVWALRAAGGVAGCRLVPGVHPFWRVGEPTLVFRVVLCMLFFRSNRKYWNTWF
jgi:hypothetical protein